MSTRILRRIACIAIAAGTGVLWMPAPANADMRLELASGGQGVILTDTGNTGVLTANTAIGVFTVNVTTGTSSPSAMLSPPPGDVAQLDLNSINIATSSAGTITIILENSSYSYNGPNAVISAIGTMGGTISNGTVTASAFVDPTNAVPTLAGDTSGVQAVSVPAIPGSAIQDLSFTSGAGSFSASSGTDFANPGTFSLYEKVVITFGSGGGTFSDDVSNTVTPEPSSLAIAGIGALGMIGYGLRRRKASRAPEPTRRTSRLE